MHGDAETQSVSTSDLAESELAKVFRPFVAMLQDFGGGGVRSKCVAGVL